MKFRRGAQQNELAINITPLIDVVFLLLIFFMVTTSFNRENWMQVNLPQANAQTPEAPAARIDVVVDRDGNYLVNGDALANNRITTLIAALERESGGDESLLVVLTADENARHQSVVTAMEGIGRAGFASLQIATRDIVQD
ncbi:MAG: biopolymer transporter ExbD [Gammaproteobacteria bacterium]|nr:biopolymer transporter ExbD [Gammaproteobacteria bacterium]MDE0480897.1 biopolymer transporter ExbD [Gammaproteobacteria bacterium]